MSDTNGQPDPDIRTTPLEDSPSPDDDPGVGAQDPGGDTDTASDDDAHIDKDPETEEDTASGGPAD